MQANGNASASENEANKNTKDLENELERCAMMPGEERRKDHDWDQALNIATETNYIDDKKDSAHFHIAPFLKMTCGLTMQHLAMLVKDKDQVAVKEKELLLQIDRQVEEWQETKPSKVTETKAAILYTTTQG